MYKALSILKCIKNGFNPARGLPHNFATATLPEVSADATARHPTSTHPPAGPKQTPLQPDQKPDINLRIAAAEDERRKATGETATTQKAPGSVVVSASVILMPNAKGEHMQDLDLGSTKRKRSFKESPAIEHTQPGAGNQGATIRPLLVKKAISDHTCNPAYFTKPMQIDVLGYNKEYVSRAVPAYPSLFDSTTQEPPNTINLNPDTSPTSHPDSLPAVRPAKENSGLMPLPMPIPIQTQTQTGPLPSTSTLSASAKQLILAAAFAGQEASPMQEEDQKIPKTDPRYAQTIAETLRLAQWASNKLEFQDCLQAKQLINQALVQLNSLDT